MTKNVNQVNVTIFGQEYPIACPPGEEDGLRKSAVRVDEEMRRIRNASKVMGTDRLAVIVALNLAHELLRSGQQGLVTKVAGGVTDGGTDDTDNPDGLDDHNQQRINKLHHDIDAALQLYKKD